MSRILILGGGVGGVTTANALRATLGKEHEITVVERRESFVLGAAKAWVMLGKRKLEEVSRPVDALKGRGVRVVRGEISKIDAAKREAGVGGETLSGDFLVLALGVDLNLGAVPGLAEAAETFYTVDGAVRLGEKLKALKSGEVLILNPRMPIKCPPAPYEVAMHLDHELGMRGVRDSVKLSVHTVEGAPMATAGPEVGKFVREELAKRKIGFFPQRKVKSVDGAARKVVFEDGEAAYDLLVAVPPHEAPKAVREAGLTGPGGWVPVDPKTLRAKAEGVYAIGDVTGVPLPGRYKPDVPLSLPKAAVFAIAHGKVVAEQIAARIQGREPKAEFDGKGFCFLEMGDRHALGGDGAFFESPHPKVTLKGPDMGRFDEKQAWAEAFLKDNF